MGRSGAFAALETHTISFEFPASTTRTSTTKNLTADYGFLKTRGVDLA
jgi:hypothetical protein